MVTLHGEHHEIGSGTVAPVSESAAAIAVIVLAILGLLNVSPGAMAAICTIVVGAALMMQGAQTVSETSRFLAAGGGAASVSGAVGGGVTLDFLAGGVGIVLGILALFTQTPVLVPAALIVFGGTLLLGGALMARRSFGPTLTTPAAPHDQAAELVAEQMAGVASGAQVMIGVAAIVLGILALVPIHGAVLVLVGLIAVGASVLVSGLATGSLMLGVFR